MSRSILAPVAAASAVAGGVALLGASLGGIASVDRQLAAAAPGGGAAASAPPAGSERGRSTSLVDARIRDRAPANRPLGWHRHEDGVRVLQLVEEGRGTVIVLLAATPDRPSEPTGPAV